MKRSLYLLLCIVLAVTLLVSCQDDSHEHTYDNATWETDETNHWHKATCEHTEEVADKAAHEDADKNGVCDVCALTVCEHTYSETWSHDNEYHWRAATCDCDVEVREKAAHVDSDNDGLCETCQWDYDHSHTYAAEWSTNETHHWHALSCTHVLGIEEMDAYGIHVDSDEDSTCDTCSYDYNHTHTFSTDAWDSADGYHWLATTCGHNVSDPAKYAEFNSYGACVDADQDETCEVCEGFVEHTHTFDETVWVSDANTHYHPATCLHTTEKSGAENHYDDNYDGKCDFDSCGAAWLGAIIDRATSDASAALINAGTYIYEMVDYYSTNTTYTYGDGFVVVKTDYSTTYYSTFTNANGETVVFAIEENSWGEVYRNEYATLDTMGADMSLSYLFSGVGAENFVYNLYDFTRTNDVIITAETYDDATKTITIGFIYFEYETTAYECNAVIVTNENNAIVSVSISANQYDSDYGDMFVFTDDNSFVTPEYYVVFSESSDDNYDGMITVNNVDYYYNVNGDGTYVIYSIEEVWNNDTYTYDTVVTETDAIALAKDSNGVYTITVDSAAVVLTSVEGGYIGGELSDTTPYTEFAISVTQTVGDKASASENLHKPEDYLLDDFGLSLNGEEIKDGDTVNLGVKEYTYIDVIAADEDAAKLPLNLFTATGFAVVEGNKTAIESNYTVLSFDYSGFSNQLVINAYTAGTYEITLTNEKGASVTFNLVIEFAKQTGISGAVDSDSSIVETDAQTVYTGVALEFTSSAPTGENPAVTVTVDGGATVAPVADKAGYYTFTASTAGTYVITLTSVADPTITATITVTVETAPDIADILNGEYEYSDWWTTYNIVFTPDSEGATTGTAVLTYDYTDAKYNPISGTETVTYSYADGVITLTHVSGGESGVVLTLVNYVIHANDTPLTFIPVIEGDPITFDELAGTWTGIENAVEYEATVNYTFTFNADGTGSVSYDMGYGAVTVTFTSVTIENGVVTCVGVDAYYRDMELVFVYSASDKALSTAEAVYGYPLTIYPKTEDNNTDDNTNTGNTSGSFENPHVITESGNVTAQYGGGQNYTLFYVYNATASGSIVITPISADYWMGAGVNPADQYYFENMGSEAITVKFNAGDKVYISPQTYSGNAGTVEFAVAITLDEASGGGTDTPVTSVTGAASAYDATDIAAAGKYSTTIAANSQVYFKVTYTDTVYDITVTVTTDGGQTYSLTVNMMGASEDMGPGSYFVKTLDANSYMVYFTVKNTTAAELTVEFTVALDAVAQA